jgi:hypothetical protein
MFPPEPHSGYPSKSVSPELPAFVRLLLEQGLVELLPLGSLPGLLLLELLLLGPPPELLLPGLLLGLPLPGLLLPESLPGLLPPESPLSYLPVSCSQVSRLPVSRLRLNWLWRFRRIDHLPWSASFQEDRRIPVAAYRSQASHPFAVQGWLRRQGWLS